MGRAFTYKWGRKEYPFCAKDKFQKYPFLPKTLFFTPLTWHACYAPSCKKSTLFKHFFLVRHVYSVIFEWSPRDPNDTLLLLFTISKYSHNKLTYSVKQWTTRTSIRFHTWKKKKKQNKIEIINWIIYSHSTNLL